MSMKPNCAVPFGVAVGFVAGSATTIFLSACLLSDTTFFIYLFVAFIGSILGAALAAND